MLDCTKCKHGQALFTKVRGINVTSIKRLDRVLCSAPRYRGRAFIRRDTCSSCVEYEPQTRARNAVEAIQ